MTKAEAIQAVADGLGQRENLEDMIFRAVKREQVLMETGGFLPWFLLTSASLPVSDSSGTVVPAAEYIRDAEEDAADTGSLFYVDTDGSLKAVIKGDVVPLLANIDYITPASTPEFYGIYKNLIYLFPAVNVDLTLKHYFYGKAATLAGVTGTDELTSTNKWLEFAPELIVARAGRRVARALRDQDALAIFNQDVQECWNTLLAADTAQREAARVRFMGEDL